MNKTILKQIIVTQNDVKIVMEYTLKELKERLLGTLVINGRYESGIIPYFKKEAENLSGEIWKTHSGTKLQVSNFGRVKKDGAILSQKDTGKNKGYLYLKDWKKLGIDFSGIHFKKINWTYQLVAETWLEKDPEQEKLDETGHWEVHHITNDGYDNRPENLIWVKKKLHDKIHGFKNKEFNDNGD